MTKRLQNGFLKYLFSNFTTFRLHFLKSIARICIIGIYLETRNDSLQIYNIFGIFGHNFRSESATKLL